MNDFIEWLNEARSAAHMQIAVASIMVTLVVLWIGFMAWFLFKGMLIFFAATAVVPVAIVAIVLVHDWRSDRRQKGRG